MGGDRGVGRWHDVRMLEEDTRGTARPELRVVVTQDGAYRVEGGPPLLRTAIVETEHGEPIAWDEGPEFSTSKSGTFELCRCGKSSRKPFCDATHEREPFDGTEKADRRPSAVRRFPFEGEGIVMTDDAGFCTHAGFCGDRFQKVWDLIDQTADPAVLERLKGMIEKCPGGRLAYSIPPDPEDVEPEFEPSIGVEPGGPLWVRGRIPVVSEDGAEWEVRNRVTLCRCGHSRNKPFCDGTHKEVGFTDPAQPAAKP
jgi:CDGSH-type Zn-finger protein